MTDLEVFCAMLTRAQIAYREVEGVWGGGLEEVHVTDDEGATVIWLFNTVGALVSCIVGRLEER